MHRFSHEAMACTWGLFVIDPDRRYAGQAAAQAFAEVDRIERELSRFIPDSDVARINALSPGQWLRVGLECWECLVLAERVHRATGGAFDVTVGALLDATAAATGAPGTPGGPFGMHLLALHAVTRSVAIGMRGLVVDLGGIGKGYALDRAAAVLRDWGLRTALLHSGQSTAVALGAPPGQPGWTVALRDPGGAGGVLGRVVLADAALSGSGAALHGAHIIDPRSGRPAAGARAAWALAPSAGLADALSTAFMVLSREAVAECCARDPLLAAWLWLDGPAGAELWRCSSQDEERQERRDD